MRFFIITVICCLTAFFTLSQDQKIDIQTARKQLFVGKQKINENSLHFLEKLSKSQFVNERNYVQFLESLDDRLQEEGKEVLYARYHFLLAQLLIAEDDYLNAYEHANQAENLLHSKMDTYYILAEKIYHTLGLIYYQFYYADDAKSYFLRSIELNPEQSELKIKAYNALGLIYTDRNQDSSLYFYHRAIDLSKKMKLKVWEPIILGNIGKIHLDKGDTLNAIKYFRLDSKLSLANEELESSFLANTMLINIYFERGEFVKFKHTLHLQDSLRKILRSPYFEYHYRRDEAVLFHLLGKYKEAYQNIILSEKYYELQKLNKIRDEELFKKRILSVNIEKINAEKQVLMIKKKSAENKLTTIVILALTSISSLLYYLIQRSQKSKRKEENLILKEKLIQQELENKENSLKETLTSLSEKARLLEEFEKVITDGSEISKIEQNKIIDKLHTLKLNTEEDLIEFKRSFAKLHPGFTEYLQSTYPDITNAELRLAALLKLKYDYAEMANLLGISVNSVRKTNSRLRIRLDINSQHELISYLQNINCSTTDD